MQNCVKKLSGVKMKYLKADRVLGSVLLLSTLIVYFKVVYFDFVNFDDFLYIIHNDHVATGLKWDNIAWAFSSFHAANWHPLTWISHMMDVSFFGLNPAGHHIINVIFHSVNSLLLFYFFHHTTGQIWRSFIIAGLFALHPLHVESVAWISERKDVLSTFFWILSMIFHFRYVQSRNVKFYFLCFSTFLLGLLSKPMVVTLPFALILLEIWPLGRFTFKDVPETMKEIKTSVLEKIPLIVLSAVSCVITYFAQDSDGAVAKLHALPFESRVANAFVSYMSYISKVIWPEGLALQYTHPVNNIDYVFLIVSVLTLSLISFLAVKYIKTKPFIFTGWFWYLGTLIPVIGLVQVGIQSMADRYTYIPVLGLFMIISFWGHEHRKKYNSYVLASSIALITISILTWNQLDFWKNSKTLFYRSIEYGKNNAMVHMLLGQALAFEGSYDEGIKHCELAIKINPFSSDRHNILGTLYASKNLTERAAFHFKESIRLEPYNWHPYSNLGQILANEGKSDEALLYLQKAEKLMIKSSYNHAMLGIAWAKIGNLDKSIEHFQESLILRPNVPDVLNKLGESLLAKDDIINAKFYIAKALEISPYDIAIINNYGLALLKEKNFEGAIIHFSFALKIYPESQKTRKNLYKAIEFFQTNLEQIK